jgi:hypothetical protein
VAGPRGDRACERRAGRRSFDRGDGFQLVERFLDEVRQVRLAGAANPAFEPDLEDGDPRFGSKACGRFRDAALAQRTGYRRGE